MVSYWKFILYSQFHTFLSKFHTLFYTFFKRFFALKVFSFIPNFYKKFRKIKWIIPEIRFKKANRGYLLTIFCHFWTKRFFLKIGPSHFLEYTETYHHAKNQKNLMSQFSRKPPHGRMHAQGSIYRTLPPKEVGSKT